MAKTDKPTHEAFVAISTGPNPTDTMWMKVGACWLHGDNEGMNVVLHSLPVGGKLVIRKVKPKDAGE